MKLASLKQKYSDIGKEPLSNDVDEFYPTIYFDGPLLEKMGVEIDRVGTEMKLVATVRIASVSESKSGSRSMSVELVAAAMGSKDEAPDKAGILFPNDRGSK